MSKLCYSFKLLVAWQSYLTVMNTNNIQLLGYETKTTLPSALYFVQASTVTTSF